jgi:PAS domain S-box-containing protein
MRNKKNNAFTHQGILMFGQPLPCQPALTQLLTSHGYVFNYAPERQEADISKNTNLPLLILLNTGNINGDDFKLCKTFKEQQHTQSIPVIFISNNWSQKEKAKAYAAGAADILLTEDDENIFFAKINIHGGLRSAQLLLEDKIAELTKVIREKEEKQEILRKSEEGYRSFVENANDVIFSMSAEGVFTYASPNFKDATGHEPADYIGKSVFESLIYPEDLPVCFAAIQKAFLTKEKQSGVEYRIIHKDGTPRWQRTNASPIFDADGKMVSIIGIARNINEEKKAAVALQNSETSYFGLFNSVTECIYILGSNGTFSNVNDSVLNMYGYTREEIIGKNPEFLYAPGKNDTVEIEKIITNAFVTGSSKEFYIWGRRKNGEIFPKEIACKKGKYFGETVLIITARDITARREAEQSLKDSEEKLLTIFNVSPDPILLSRLEDGTIVDANNRAFVAGGYNRSEVIGKKTLDLNLWKSTSDREEFVFKLLHAQGKLICIAKDIVNKKGEVRKAAIYGEIIELNGEKLILTVIHDITDHQKAEEEIKERVLQLQTLGDNLPDTMVYQMIREAGRKIFFTYLSRGIEKITGLPADALLQDPELLYNLILEEDKPILDAALEDSFNHMTLLDVQIRLKCFSGEIRWFQIRCAPRKLPDGRILWDGVQTDITEKKLAHQKLQESETRWQFALDSGQHGVWDWDTVTNKVFFSQNWKTIIGFDDDEIGDTLEEWDSRVHPEDKEMVYSEIKKYLDGITPFYESEHRLLCKDGSYKWIHDVGKACETKADGTPSRIIGTHTDINKRKKAEEALQKTLSKLYKQQLYNQQLVTELTVQELENERSKISIELHENVNQVLAVAKLYLGLVQTRSDEPDSLLEKSQHHLNQAMEMINRLSSSLFTPLLKDFGLVRVLAELVEEINKSGTLQVQLKNDARELDSAETGQVLMFYRIVQVLMNNIIEHARATEAKIALYISNGNIFLAVEDNGQGFDIKKPNSGFGLVHMKNRVEFYGGGLHVSSSPGKGCRVEISVPLRLRAE